MTAKTKVFQKNFLNSYGLASAPAVSTLPAILNTVSLSSVEDTVYRYFLIIGSLLDNEIHDGFINCFIGQAQTDSIQ